MIAQLRACGSDLRQQLTLLARALEEAQEKTRQQQRMLAQVRRLCSCWPNFVVDASKLTRGLWLCFERRRGIPYCELQAEREVQASRGVIDADMIVRQGLEAHNAQLQQENVALERNLMALRRLVSDKHGVSEAAQPYTATGTVSSSAHDIALIAHLEARAKESEQRAESMMFQKNEAQSRRDCCFRRIFVRLFRAHSHVFFSQVPICRAFCTALPAPVRIQPDAAPNQRGRYLS